MDKHELNLRGAEVGWVWAFSGHLWFSCRSTDFINWQSFRKWLFDPEVGFERLQRVYPGSSPSVEVPIFWPHAAIRLAGLDLALGLCVRPPIQRHLEERSDDA